MNGIIQKWGNSHAIRLPKQILADSTLNEYDEVELSAEKGIITIKKITKKALHLKDLFESYNGDYECEEADTSKPVGKEEL